MILSGYEVAASMREALRARIARLGSIPTLAILQIGADSADSGYARAIERVCAQAGIRLIRRALPTDCAQAEPEAQITEWNADNGVHGILVFRPLPAPLDEARIAARLTPEKDVDCMTRAALAEVYLGGEGGFAPCTAEACMRILSHYNIDCAGKHAVVIGRSAVVGRPLAELLLRKNATVTVCHSKTRQLAALCRSADLLVAAAGRRHLVTEDFVKPGAVVLDVGIHWDAETGTMTGDVDYDAVAPIAGAITPVPGGVGAVTSTVLAAHTVLAAERSQR